MKINLFNVCLGVSFTVIAYVVGGLPALIGAIVGTCICAFFIHDNSDRRRR